MIGRTISHYKILTKLARGGMGVVYKAEDTKLKRAVALKFLATHLLGESEVKARFIREAQAAAALDHPNICTVYEIDEFNGQVFIAMAFLGGQELAQQITAGPLKADRILDFAIQIAQGLQEAHRKSIVHRDIKPANIMVTTGGQVVLMDFGLAQLAAADCRLTKEGTILGTSAYMSPEQTSGEKTDQRTDIWALGVVIYEMATGQLPFKGRYEQAVVYSILNEEPEPITGLRTGVSIELERIVNKALAKRPDERYQRIDDLLADLRALRSLEKISLDLIDPARGRTLQSWRFREQSLIRIGRSKQNDVVIRDPSASRFHAELHFQNGRWELANLGRNGILIKGEKIELAPLEDGTVFQLSAPGPSLRFHVFDTVSDAETTINLTSLPDFGAAIRTRGRRESQE